MAQTARIFSKHATSTSPRFLLDAVVKMAIAAGDLMMTVFDHPSRLIKKEKADGSIVTNVDEETSNLLITRLSALTPHIPILTEEIAETADKNRLEAADQVWLVDPLDGTSEFTKGLMGFSVNIALMEGKKPVLGVIYQPALALGFCAVSIGKSPAWLFHSESGRVVLRTPMKTTTPMAKGELSTVFRETSGNGQIYGKLRSRLAENAVRISEKPETTPGLIREMRIAMGRNDLCVKLGSKPGPVGGGYPWDVAAMIPIVEKAGGHILSFDGSPFEIGPLTRRVPSYLIFPNTRIAQKAAPALQMFSEDLRTANVAKDMQNPLNSRDERKGTPSETSLELV